MKEIGLIFSAETVRANILGKKTMTRRTRGLDKINEDPELWCSPFYDSVTGFWNFWQVNTGDCLSAKCPFEAVGDLIWQRETFYYDDEMGKRVLYKADGAKANFNYGGPWKPAIHMFRWMSRFVAPITELPVPERLQEITAEDCRLEGIDGRGMLDPYIRNDFKILWDSKNAAKGLGWDFNPWVWPIRYQNNLTVVC